VEKRLIVPNENEAPSFIDLKSWSSIRQEKQTIYPCRKVIKEEVLLSLCINISVEVNVTFTVENQGWNLHIKHKKQKGEGNINGDVHSFLFFF